MEATSNCKICSNPFHGLQEEFLPDCLPVIRVFNHTNFLFYSGAQFKNSI